MIEFSRSDYRLKTPRFHDGEQLERGAAGLLFAALPFAHQFRLYVQHAGEHALAHAFALAQRQDLLAGQRLDRGETRRSEFAHRPGVEEAGAMQAARRLMRGFRDRAAKFLLGLRRHAPPR